MGWSIATNPALQAPIALANPAGAIGLSGLPPGMLAFASQVPRSAALALASSPVTLNTGLVIPATGLIITSPLALVVPRQVTLVAPGGGALALAGIAPIVVVGSSSGNANFFADPYSNYSSFIVDTTFAGTAGASTTVPWNGVTITAPTYSTLQAAINAAAQNLMNTGVPSRAIGLNGQTHPTGGLPFHIPFNTGTIATPQFPFVVQGDPASHAPGQSTPMPQINGNAGPEGGWAIGSAPSGSAYAAGNDNRNTVIRKFEITNFLSTATGVYGFALGTNFAGRYDGFIAEFCSVHLFRYSLTGGEGGAGPVYTFNPNVSDNFELRYCKMFDNLGTDGTTGNRPFACVETYGGSPNIHHNEFYGSATCFSGKVLTPKIPNGSLHHNLIHDIGNSSVGMIEGEAGGEGPGYNGFYVYNNLFYWTHYNDAAFGSPGAAECYNDFGANGNTTAPTDIRFYNNTFIQALSNSGSGVLENVNTTAVQFYNNVILGTFPIVTDEQGHAGQVIFCDYNVYFNPTAFYMAFEGTNQVQFTSFASWQKAHTNHPTLTGLTADPDAHGINIGALAAPWNTIAANFPNLAANDYTIAPGSPLKGAGFGGGDPGYNPLDCGPGW